MGEAGVPHDDPDGSPGGGANKVRGHGTWDTDRPPVCGVVGRESGQVRLTVAKHSDGETLRGVVGSATAPGAMIDTDEWGGYNGLPGMDRDHATVCHKIGEWARDDDGDGVREVHDARCEPVDGAAKPPALPRCEQEVPVAVCGDVRVDYNEAGDAEVSWSDPGGQAHHHLPYMSRKIKPPTIASSGSTCLRICHQRSAGEKTLIKIKKLVKANLWINDPMWNGILWDPVLNVMLKSSVVAETFLLDQIGEPGKSKSRIRKLQEVKKGRP